VEETTKTHLGTRKSSRRKAMKAKEKQNKSGKKSKSAMEVEGAKPM
jgi:hypothetical protein